LLPWLLGVLFYSSFRLPRPLNGIAIGGQVFTYSLALLDPLVAQGSSLKRASSAARTLVVLMAATIIGLKILFVPPQSLWKVTNIASTDS
jgi:hypothetical protein